jgi:type II secretory pathway pseudopilin PulG
MKHRPPIAAFTLLELLIALGIVVLLLQLIIPAAEIARESARRVQCTNNMRQIALAIQTHESVSRRLRSEGWTAKRVSEPERGTDVDQ